MKVMRRFYNKRHSLTYRERTEEKKKNALDDDDDNDEENDVDEYGNEISRSNSMR